MKGKRECRKCGNVVPWYKNINGKRKYLSNRKFCLECSPFNGNNRRSDDPSIKPKRKNRYEDFSEDQKETHKVRVLRKKYERKLKLIKMSGGGCIKCGYNKNIRALSFHHREPEKKVFGLNINTLGRNWDSIIEEYKKCDLLCLNCHAEIESKKSPIKYKKFEEIIKNGVKNGIIRGDFIPIEKIKCKCCKKKFKPVERKIKCCSQECSNKVNRKVKNRPTKEELQELIDTTPMTKIGKMFGVSDNAIRKWAKSYGVTKNKLKEILTENKTEEGTIKDKENKRISLTNGSFLW